MDEVLREALGIEKTEPIVDVEAYVRVFSNIRHLKARRFLSVYAQGHGINETSRITGIDTRYHYLWKQVVPGYLEAFEKATEIRADLCEDEIFRRGVMGYSEELSYKGENTGSTVKRYSDVLAIVAAKALRPHRYRENLHANVTVNVPVSVQFVLPERTNSVSSDTPQTLEIKADNE